MAVGCNIILNSISVRTYIDLITVNDMIHELNGTNEVKDKRIYTDKSWM